MIEKVKQYMSRHQMTGPREAVCVGVSGGADSVCLLLLMKACLSGSGQTLSAVHVNHMLRGDEADADEAFVRDLCARLEIPLRVYRSPAARIAAREGIGTEEAGRLARQEAYRDCVTKHGATRIALAHHAGDRAETFLFHAARGSSLAGLAGIRPVQRFAAGPGKEDMPEMVIIRPLLCVTRTEIEAWLAEQGQTWRTDATNEEDTFVRNGIRHTVIPYLEEHVNAQAVRHIAEAAADLAETDDFLRGEAERRSARHVTEVRTSAENREKNKKDPSGHMLRVEDSLIEEPAFLQGRILLDCMEALCGSRKDLGRTQVGQLRELFMSETGKQAVLPYGLRAVREYGGILLYTKAERDPESGPAEDVPGTGPGTYCRNGWQFDVRVLKRDEAPVSGWFLQDPPAIPEKKYTKWLDYDKIERNLCLRSRRSGDRLVVNASGGSRKLKDYLIDEKIPRMTRDGIPVLASGPDVYWVVGHRISEEGKVTAATERILEIRAEKQTGEMP